MEEDEDDFYGGARGSVEGADEREHQEGREPSETKEVNAVAEQEEDEDSEDDVKFTLEKPEDSRSETAGAARNARQESVGREQTEHSDRKRPTKNTAGVKEEQRNSSTAPPPAVAGTLTHNGKEGKDFPGTHTSRIDVDGNPTWPANRKSIIELDIDADLAEESKPWRLPGTDQTDFFNYGFDEYTWAQYCMRQQTLANTLVEQKQADAQMKAMFSGGLGGPQAGGSGMPPGMPPMPNMPGMPSPEEMQQMMASGMNVDSFMQMMMNGGAGGVPGNNPQQGGGGYGQASVGGFGSVHNTASPRPQTEGGFQPPQGPSGHSQHGDPGGFGVNTEGYSPQQLAIMQQQGGTGGRRAGRGRRGGFY